MQATIGMKATTITPATSNYKEDSNIMTVHNSRSESNNRTANTVRMPPRAGMLAKTVKPPTAAETIGTSQRQHQKGDP
jgi:hypothetical protein